MEPVHYPPIIKRQRTKGWRKPEGAIYVGRASDYENIVAMPKHASLAVRVAQVAIFEETLLHYITTRGDRRHERLKGHAIMCWCYTWHPLMKDPVTFRPNYIAGPPLHCHAGVWWRLANYGTMNSPWSYCDRHDYAYLDDDVCPRCFDDLRLII